MIPGPDEVLLFWFGPDEPPGDRSPFWFRRSEATDRAIRERFGGLRDRAVRLELAEWELSPRGRLALIIVVDQFSRNLFRNDPRAFEHDAFARQLCLEGLAAGDDAALHPVERVFFYLPLEHSESLDDQNRSVTLFETLAASVIEADRPRFEGYLDYARQHRDIIARFGRFPHRNAVLGRPSTPEEEAFLKLPGSSF